MRDKSKQSLANWLMEKVTLLIRLNKTLLEVNQKKYKQVASPSGGSWAKLEEEPTHSLLESENCAT